MNLAQSNKKTLFASLLFTSLLGLASTVHASFYDKALGSKPSRLLNNRLTIMAPSTSSRDEININLNSEKNVFKDRTILDYQYNKKTLRVIATELFVWRTENLQGNLATLLHAYPQTIGLKYQITQLDRNRYELIPSKFVLVKGQALVRTLFFVNSDSTLQSIDIFMNAEAIKYPKKSKELATKLLASIKSGKRELRKGPRTIKLGSKKKPYQFRIRIPKGYVVSSKRQNDARIHIIRKLVPLGSSQTSLAIYVGPKPSPYRSHFGEYNTSGATTYSQLLGNQINWYKLKKSNKLKRHMVRASKILTWTDKNKHSHQHYIHVFADSETSKGMKRLVKLASKLAYVHKPKNQYAAIRSGNYYNATPRLVPEAPRNNNNYLGDSQRHQTQPGRDQSGQQNNQTNTYDNRHAKREPYQEDHHNTAPYNNQNNNQENHSYSDGFDDGYSGHNDSQNNEIYDQGGHNDGYDQGPGYYE